jgi:hypothetical protein
MRKLGFNLTGMAILLVFTLEGCSSKSAPAPTPPAMVAYVLTVNSTNPASGAVITATLADNSSKSSGTSSFTFSYNADITVVLTAAATDDGYSFVSWTGCTTTVGNTCTVALNANTTVTANYSQPSIQSVTVTPTTAVTIGSAQQFTANVSGSNNYNSAVIWSFAAPAGSTLSPGTLTATGLYTTPYPAPASVTITATSVQDPTKSAAVVIPLSPPAPAAGPALTVDTANQTHAISPYIYGMNAYLLDGTDADAAAVAPANISIDRWGGDSTERYNYQLDVTNAIADYYFENSQGAGGDGWLAVPSVSAFDALVNSNNSKGIKTLGTVPVLGWVAKDSTSCSFPQSTYPSQVSFASNGCGDGLYPKGVSSCTNSSGCYITGNNPDVASIPAPPPTPPAASAVNAAWAQSTWTGGWVTALVNQFGPGNPSGGNGKGVAIYDLDNEPSWWDTNDVDVHPLPFTYDEVTNGGIGTALAIKTADPTAEVSGPVMDWWWGYFYSKKDIESGWTTGGGPCYEPWSNPVDRKAHNGIPFIEYYLQQMAQAETTYGVRLLDYLDLHTYLAASYKGQSVALTTAGDTGMQQARLNSTRAFWDTTYTDPNYTQPNYITDANYTASCSLPLQAPQLIPMMKTWVSNDYPGTKLAIDEYNWGGMESINGAVAEADVLGIFGREGLDVGTMWPTGDPSGQIPGMMAFAIYRNYDGNNSTFGNQALASTSANQGQLSVYGALRTSDNSYTIVVLNKTFGDLTSTVSLAHHTAAANETAKVYLYSNANLSSIVAQTSIAVTPPASGTTSAITTTFPAQSITLFIVP